MSYPDAGYTGECHNLPAQSTPPYIPTPEEIKAACEEIQAEWTPAEREHRSNFKRPKAVEVTRSRVVLEIPQAFGD